MNFSKKRPVKIVMLGAGGTGAHIAPHLYRLLYALERPVKFIICDGDKVEPKNLVRQNFTEADLGENKARVIAERYSDVFGLETSYIPRFIEDAGQLEELLRPEVFRHYVYGSEPNTGRWVTNSELVILIGAVDNNKSRKLCHEVFLRARDLVYIDSGNGEYSSSNNKLGLEYRELMEHLKDKDPEYYYSDILIPKKETLGEFKTMRIATQFRDKKDRLNQETIMEIAQELYTVEQQISKLEFYVSQLEEKQAEVIRKYYFEGKTWGELQREMHLAPRTLLKRRDDGLDALVSIYSYIGQVKGDRRNT